MLQITNLEAGYGKKQVLFNVSMEIPEEKITAIIGPNGSGKSTILKAIFGLLDFTKGSIVLDGLSLINTFPSENVHNGIRFCPQGNRVFDELSVLENLQIGGQYSDYRFFKSQLEEMLRFFPVLRDRLTQSAAQLSGGEQQQLSLARSLISNPKLLMLDEPSLGLAPSYIKSVFDKILHINRNNKTTILIVEQKVDAVLEIADKVYSLKLGKVVYEGGAGHLKGDTRKLKKLFL